MPPVCSCGATLPEDARFCHRCGKPQRDEFPDIQREAPPPALVVSPPPTTLSSTKQGVTFSNPLVLRTSLLVASLTTILEIIPYVGFAAPIIGGFASASLYQRRSGQVLTPASGAKLGWITAILNALLFTIFMSLNFAVAGAAMFDALRENVKQQASSPAQIQALQMMNDPRFLALIVLMLWVVLFVMSSVLYMAGGALAARMYRQKAS